MSRRRRRRVVETVPRVYVGPAVWPVVGRCELLLLGRKRAGSVDVTEAVCPRAKGVVGLVAERLDTPPPRGAEIVGVAGRAERLRRHWTRLVRELVPGDVVLLAAGAEKGSVRAYVHDGARLEPVPLRSRSRVSI